MAKKILIGVAVVLVLLVVVIATRPSTYHVERSATLGAPADVVFAQVNDFHIWNQWSPWEKLDPKMKKEHSGAPAGVGAVYYWNGNDDVGEGRMTIEESKANELVSIKLEFLRPFASTSRSSFRLAPDGAGTKITWAMDGTNDFMGKAFSMFMDMDSMIGKDFEKGLSTLKGMAETEAKKREEARKAAEAAAAAPPPEAAVAPGAPAK